jgi:hypothetical protein
MCAVAYLKSEEDKGDGVPSSYSTLRNGGKAAYLLLQQSGYPVERWNRSPQDLPVEAEGVILILAGPESFASGPEHVAIQRFLQRGGSVLVVGTLPDTYVPEAAAAVGDPRIGMSECISVAPTRLTRGGPISQDGNLYWNSSDESHVVHYQDETEQAVVVSYTVGRGQVVWWASALPLTNAGIRDRKNLDLLLNSVGDSRRILWDEYYHSEHAWRGMRDRIGAVPWALGQLAFLAVMIVWTYSRRSGPTVPLSQESRLSPLEFVEMLDNVFHRAGKSPVAVEIAFHRFRQIATRRLGIKGTATAPEIVDAMSQRGLKLPEATAALVRDSESAISDPDLPGRLALEHVRALNEAARLLEPAGPTTKGRT